MAKFACSFLDKDKKPTEREKDCDSEIANVTSADYDDEEDLPLFMYSLFAWLLDHHEALYLFLFLSFGLHKEKHLKPLK